MNELIFFFFNQKTAYEMRISDWRSDVCSSDLTPLQTNFAVNTVALVDGVPRTLNLVQALQAYIDHQADVIRRRSAFRLKKAQDRAHIVEGLLKAADGIDTTIALSSGSETRGRARAGTPPPPSASPPTPAA